MDRKFHVAQKICKRGEYFPKGTKSRFPPIYCPGYGLNNPQFSFTGSSGVASPKICGWGQTIWGWGKMFDFRRITLFCLEKRLSNHKMTMFSKHLVGHGPFGPPGYTYDWQ